MAGTVAAPPRWARATHLAPDGGDCGRPAPWRGLRTRPRCGASVAAMVRRSPYDREILRLAVPALGALAAEPLYVLVDTAIVGHLGTTELAALRDRRHRCSARCSPSATSSSTGPPRTSPGCTARAARHEAARDRQPGAVAGLRDRLRDPRLGSRPFAAPVARALGGTGEVQEGAVLYLRIAALGAPFFMIANAGQGYLRGVCGPAHAARHPRRRARGQRRARGAVRLRLRLGPRRVGVGHGHRAGRHGGGVRRASRCRAGLERPRPCADAPAIRVGSEIAVRTTALLVAFLVSLGGARPRRRPVARRPPDRLPAVDVPRAGARRDRDRRRRSWSGGCSAPATRAAPARPPRRMIGWSTALGALFGARAARPRAACIPHAFTDDPAVIDRTQAVWPLFVAMMPPSTARCSRWTASSSAPRTPATSCGRCSPPRRSTCRSPSSRSTRAGASPASGGGSRRSPSCGSPAAAAALRREPLGAHRGSGLSGVITRSRTPKTARSRGIEATGCSTPAKRPLPR